MSKEIKIILLSSLVVIMTFVVIRAIDYYMAAKVIEAAMESVDKTFIHSQKKLQQTTTKLVSTAIPDRVATAPKTQPKVAYIGDAKPKLHISTQDRLCNELILKAMKDKSAEVRDQKKLACAHNQ